MKHQARKRFGQHFLTDLSVIDAIVRAIDPQNDQFLIEIGPGQAALTAPLLDRVNHITAIELDRDLIRLLRHKWPENRLSIIESDVLQVDFGAISEHQLRIIGNLPYNISTPLLFHLLQWSAKIKDQIFMLQREIVERMAAQPGDSQYGRLSILMQMHYKIRYLFDVPPDAFDPPPKVVSAIVKMIPRAAADIVQPDNYDTFNAILDRVFQQRRKMLRASLGDMAKTIDWEAIGIKPTARPQELDINQYISLANYINHQPG